MSKIISRRFSIGWAYYFWFDYEYFWFLKICGPNGPNVKISVSIKKRIAWGFQNSPYFWLWCPFCGSYSFSNMGTGTFFWDTLYIFNKALIFFYRLVPTLSLRTWIWLISDLKPNWCQTFTVYRTFCQKASDQKKYFKIQWFSPGDQVLVEICRDVLGAEH